MEGKGRRLSSLKKRKKVRQPSHVVECLQLPKDACMGMELLAVCGGEELTLRNFQKLLRFEEGEIAVQTKRCRIRILGNGLMIGHYTEAELGICGRIQSICYERRQVSEP